MATLQKILPAFLGDQPELDSICCDTSESCKQCNCDRAHLHLPDKHRPKHAVHIMLIVYRASKNGGILVRKAWSAAANLTFAGYNRAYKAAGGIP